MIIEETSNVLKYDEGVFPMFSIKNFVKSYEIKKSKTDHNVPVINGIYLHSMYDPIKEAYELVESYKDKIRLNPNILVFGLGFGYHIKTLWDTLNDLHGPKAHLTILDPNKRTFDDYLKINKETNNISYYITDQINECFNEKNFINFLIKSPTIIKHTASFELYHSFYKLFLSYQSPAYLQQYLNKIENESLKKNLSENLAGKSKISLHQYIEDLKKSRKCLNKYDHMLIALNEMNPIESRQEVSK